MASASRAGPSSPETRSPSASGAFTIQYVLTPEAQHELETLLTEDENIFGKSLLEKAGLSGGTPPAPRRPQPPKQQRSWPGHRIDPTELDE